MSASQEVTAWVVYCTTHRHLLKFVGSTGTTWTDNHDEAKRYDNRRAAGIAAERASWLDHTPVPWAIASSSRGGVVRAAV